MKAAEEKKKKSSSSNAPEGSEVETQQPAPSGPGDGQSVDRIRDIIFGPQMRDYEQRFQGLEERLLREAAELRKHVDERFERLHEQMAKEVASLSSHLEEERKARSQSDSDILQQLRALNETLERKLEDQGGLTHNNLEQLKAELADNTEQLSKAISTQGDTITKRLNQEVEDLRSAKTDRATLASLLEQIAAKLQSG